MKKLDSKSIFISSSAYLDSVRWESKGSDPDSMWIYLGLNEDFNEALLTSTINKIFRQTTVYFVDGRSGSTWYPTADVSTKIKNRINHANRGLFVWDHEFTTVLEVKSIGVFRYGVRGG